MTVATPVRRMPAITRRVGCAIAVAINAAMLYVINVSPGWQVVPVLTGDTRQVLGLLNASIIAGLAVNAVYLALDPPWLRSAGDLVTAGFGLAVLVRVWQVFPFDFSDYSFDWAVVVRFVLVIVIAAATLGVVVNMVTLVRRIVHLGRGHDGR